MKRLALLCALLPATVSAQPFMVLSNGQDQCGQYADATLDAKAVYLEWALGFISGTNIFEVGPRRNIGTGWKEPSIRLWLDNYCRANPLETFVGAVMKLREALAAEEGIPPKSPEKSP